MPAASACYWCPRPAELSRSKSLLVLAASARYWCSRPEGLSRSESFKLPLLINGRFLPAPLLKNWQDSKRAIFGAMSKRASEPESKKEGEQESKRSSKNKDKKCKYEEEDVSDAGEEE